MTKQVIIFCTCILSLTTLKGSDGKTTSAPVDNASSNPKAKIDNQMEKLDWIIGHWRNNADGKVFWPTIPKMTYGEELLIYEAPVAKIVGIRFLNFTARAWSPSANDHMHNELGFMTIDNHGNVTLMTTADNGFTTFEEGWVEPKKLILRLKKIGRISFSRDLPVEDLERRFSLLNDNHLEQSLAMRTSTHPKVGILDHAYIVYEKLRN